MGTALQDAVFNAYPVGECELEKTSSASPGPVGGDELLTKLIVSPIHIDEQTGQVHPLAFVDATTVDLSVFREALATDTEIQTAINEIKETGAAKAQAQVRTIQLVLQATAGAVRGLRYEDPDRRMCMVYDTALPDKPAHASVFTPTEARKGASQRKVRKALLALFSQKQIQLVDYRPLNF